MKPTLLYLRKYIDENYKGNHHQLSLRKGAIEKQIKQKSEEWIFKEKKRYYWKNQKQKQLYFKVPKSFNVQRRKKKVGSELRKTNQTEQVVNTLFLKSQQLNQPKQKSTKSDTYVRQVEIVKEVLSEKKLNQENEARQHQQKNDGQGQVRIKIISPVSSSNLSSGSSSKMRLNQNQQCKTRQEDQKRKLRSEKLEQRNEKLPQMSDKFDCFIEKQTNQLRSDHSRKVCNSMKKVGYNTLFDYLAEMKRFQSIAKKQIKQAHYYPLACMASKVQAIQLQQLRASKQKAFAREKTQQYSKLIQVQNNFSIKSIAIDNLSQITEQNKLKSNQSKVSQLKKQYEQTYQNIDRKEKRLLLQYQQIVICNCTNKRFFTQKLSKNSDYNSFLKFATPLLQTTSNKENNYMIEKKEPDICSLYFCCLINTTLGQRDYFFWIGKPIQYYRKALVIKIIDDFLLEVKAFNALEREKLLVVDVYGKNSFISRNILIKCTQNKFMSKSKPKKEKEQMKASKRISPSQQRTNIVMTQSFLNLMPTSSDFGEYFCLKKEKNNISTRGTFKMVYN